MHLQVFNKLLAFILCFLYLPSIARGLSYSVNELIDRAEVVDLDSTVDDTADGDDDGTTAATGTQDTSSDTSTGKTFQEYIVYSFLTNLEYDWPWPVIPDSGAHNGISDGLGPADRPYINYALNTIEGAIPAEHRSLSSSQT